MFYLHCRAGLRQKNKPLSWLFSWITEEIKFYSIKGGHVEEIYLTAIEFGNKGENPAGSNISAKVSVSKQKGTFFSKFRLL